METASRKPQVRQSVKPVSVSVQFIGTKNGIVTKTVNVTGKGCCLEKPSSKTPS